MMDTPTPPLMLRLKNDRRGVTALEYGLIASLIVVVIIGGITAMGASTKVPFDTIAAAI
jgi:pilus assembly protein Flp/PilA